jgi:hypothetical protein
MGEIEEFCHRPQNERPTIDKVRASTKNQQLVFLCFESVNQPPRVMDGKACLTFPDSGNDTIQGSIARTFTRNVAHSTIFPNIKSRLNVLR